ncbi:MAG: hypothetical protein PHR61_01310 [Candidatus Absconditabacteria bacterium]|nr:hypothetical protein [Candidatus Absconditabacteria bacterium]
MYKKDFKHQVMMLLQKFTRFTKQQKSFVLYLFGLTFLMIFFPIIKVSPVSGQSYGIWILNGAFFTTMIILLVSLGFLLSWNMSFRFKTMVINSLGFRDNDSLINFAFIAVITTIFFSIGNTIGVVNNVTATISLSKIYYFTWFYLLAGLIFLLITIIKKAKESAGKTKIINVVDEKALKEISNRKSLKGLFDHEKVDEE